MAQQREERVLLPDPGRSEELSVGTDLSWRLRVLIHSGRLAPSDRLPGVREFAAGAGVNVNTARSVYGRLEGEGLAVSQQGLGTFVAPYVPIAPTLEQFAAQVAAEAIAQGIDPRELARALYAGSPPRDPFTEPLGEDLLAEPRTAEEERDARRTLRGQIARLEARLAPYPEAKGAERSATLGYGPRVATIDELEAIRDELLGRLKQAQEEAEKRDQRREVARRWREEALADPASHRWESVSAEDLGEPGCGRLVVRPAWGPVGALMNWWRVKISSGCP